MRPRGLDRLSTRRVSAFRRVDLVLVGSVFALALLGVVMVYSATRSSRGGGEYFGFALRQSTWVFVGLCVMAAVAWFDYRRIPRMVPWLYGGACVLLLAVLTPLGSASKGAQAWFELGGMQLQPSEFAKLVVIVTLGAYCALQQRAFAYRHVVMAVVIAGFPMLLILAQPDFGTMLVFAAILVTMLVVAGAPWRAIVGLLAAAVLLFVLAISLGVLKQYQLDRLGAFLDPQSNVQQSAYNLNQSKIAIGSGGLTGTGLFQGAQTTLRYVPEQHTDFIFTAVGEELGFVGGVSVLALFAAVLWRILAIARATKNAFGQMIAVGVAGMLLFQIFENVGMTMGIMPITGIPLPFLSYGGSSTLVAFAALGLVVSVGRRVDES